MKKSLLIKTTFVENHLLSRINQSGRLVYLCLFILFTSLLQANNITQGPTLYLTTGAGMTRGQLDLPHIFIQAPLQVLL